MSPIIQELYDIAIRADAKFQSALEHAYGKRAGDMRYQTRALPPDIRLLALNYQVAIEAWKAAYRNAR